MQTFKQTVLDMAQKCYTEKLFTGTSGNLSAFNPKLQLIAITPSGISYTSMTIDDITIIDLNGNIIEGKQSPSSEWQLHTAIYNDKPQINAIIHTHSTYATACATLRIDIPVITIETLKYIGSSIPVTEFAFNGTPAVGEYAVKSLKNSVACLLPNHGAVALGENLEQAFLTAMYTENAAMIYLLAKSAGNPVLISNN